ncbi:hypothetical protein GUJ93_ZPchr0010g9559 [Zizania palustris]|uniref:Uncharacterized protein n=1 Tax=Zizania palustris TaxID=103762 RepID=A0A8J5T9N7_ZIZPA|nr:hypothetical protein GUJ93_ZPchr0010g9559 [Zizania palustris]
MWGPRQKLVSPIDARARTLPADRLPMAEKLTSFFPCVADAPLPWACVADEVAVDLAHVSTNAGGQNQEEW